MATFNWPGFGIASVSWTLDQPAQVNRSAYTGVRSVASTPWHGKWSAKVQLGTKQGDAAFQAIRAFFTSLQGPINNFHLPAVEAPQSYDAGVTVSVAASAGATSLTLTGISTALVAGNMVTVAGQLLSIISASVLSASVQTISFEPALRAAAPVGTYAEVAQPYALVALTDSSFSWDIGQWRRYGLSFDVEEDIGGTDGALSSGDIWNATPSSSGGSGVSGSSGTLPWGKYNLAVPSSDAAGSVHGIWLTVTNPNNPGYGYYAEYSHSGSYTGNDIASALLSRRKSITNGSGWLNWYVSSSPLNPSSGFTNAPSSTQLFAMVVSEANPLSRHSDCGLAYDARHWSNWHGGHDMVPETKDFWGELGGARIGYNIPFAYGLSKSPQTATDTQRNARIYFGLFGRPNAIAANGAFTFCTGYVNFITGVAVASGGVGYSVGDILALASGLSLTVNQDAFVRVTSVSGGVITGVEVYDSGYYQQTFATPVGVTGGTGSGATFTYTLSTTAEAPRAFALLAGRWQYGMDGVKANTAGSYTGESIFTGGMIRAPNNQVIICARNAAATADVTGLKLNSSDQFELVGQNIITPVAFTPTITPDTGSGTYTLSSARYSKINGRVAMDVVFQVTSAGTAGGGINVTLPISTTKSFIGSAMNISDSSQLLANGSGGSGSLKLTLPAGGNASIASKFYVVSAIYEV